MLYRAKIDGDVEVKRCKIVGRPEIIGYKKVNEYFVDNSGFGADDEPALTFDNFINKVKAGFYYGILEAGQFQVYIGEYVKIDRKSQLTELGIISTKKVANNTRLTMYVDGRRVLTLHSTDIITWRPDGKIVLTSGGWHTTTTKTRLNAYLPTGIYVYQKNYQWYIDRYGEKIEFTDGIEIAPPGLG